MFDTVEWKFPSTILRVDQYFNFIIASDKNSALYKYIIQNCRACLGPFQKLFYLIIKKNKTQVSYSNKSSNNQI